jgi:hypothetical protein
MKSIRRHLRSSLVVIAPLLLVAGPAGADISIEFDDVIRGPEGSLKTVAQVDVPPEFVGDLCVLSVIAENQASVHVGNDLIVSTGDSQAVILGVEDEAFEPTSQDYAMVVGSTIVVELRFGKDALSSLGFGLSFDCEPLPGAIPDLETQVAEQSAPTTTTTVAPPATSSTLPPPPAVITETTVPDCSDTIAVATAPAGTDVTTASASGAPDCPTTTTTVASCPDASTADATTDPSAVAPAGDAGLGTGEIDSCGTEPANVAGATTNDLPESPAPVAVVAAPAYTG